MSGIFSFILNILTNHIYLTPFISGFITEEALFVIALIGGKEMVPFYAIIFFGFLGIVASDIFWFLFIKIKPFNFLAKKFSKKRKQITSKSKLGNLPPPTNLRSYILTKFTFGLRTWGIFYCSIHKMPLKKFIINTAIATLVWMTVMLTLAKIIGKSIFIYFEISKDLGEIVLISLVVIVIITSLVEFITCNILKKSNKKCNH